jgi:hypothetical protein
MPRPQAYVLTQGTFTLYHKNSGIPVTIWLQSGIASNIKKL